MGADQLSQQLLDGACPGEKVVILDGILNAGTAFEFRDSLRPHEATTMVIDMSGVRYVDSSGLGVLIGAYVSFERKGGRLLLAGMTDRVWELFRVCKIQDVFTRFPTVAAAEESVANPSEPEEVKAAPASEELPKCD